jgi:hypothetical protein
MKNKNILGVPPMLWLLAGLIGFYFYGKITDETK